MNREGHRLSKQFVGILVLILSINLGFTSQVYAENGESFDAELMHSPTKPVITNQAPAPPSSVAPKTPVPFVATVGPKKESPLSLATLPATSTTTIPPATQPASIPPSFTTTIVPAAQFDEPNADDLNKDELLVPETLLQDLNSDGAIPPLGQKSQMSIQITRGELPIKAITLDDLKKAYKEAGLKVVGEGKNDLGEYVDVEGIYDSTGFGKSRIFMKENGDGKITLLDLVDSTALEVFYKKFVKKNENLFNLSREYKKQLEGPLAGLKVKPEQPNVGPEIPDNIKAVEVQQHTFDVRKYEKGKVEQVQTCGVGHCLALIVYGPKKKVGGVAHIDANTTIGLSIDAILEALKGAEVNPKDIPNLQWSIVGGQKGQSEKILKEIIEKLNALNIVPSVADLQVADAVGAYVLTLANGTVNTYKETASKLSKEEFDKYMKDLTSSFGFGFFPLGKIDKNGKPVFGTTPIFLNQNQGIIVEDFNK